MSSKKFELGNILISSEILTRCTEQDVRDALDKHEECQWDFTDTMWVLDNMINIKKGSGDVKSVQGPFYIITDLLIKRTDVFMQIGAF